MGSNWLVPTLRRWNALPDAPASASLRDEVEATMFPRRSMGTSGIDFDEAVFQESLSGKNADTVWMDWLFGSFGSFRLVPTLRRWNALPDAPASASLRDEVEATRFPRRSMGTSGIGFDEAVFQESLSGKNADTVWMDWLFGSFGSFRLVPTLRRWNALPDAPASASLRDEVEATRFPRRSMGTSGIGFDEAVFQESLSGKNADTVWMDWLFGSFGSFRLVPTLRRWNALPDAPASASLRDEVEATRFPRRSMGTSGIGFFAVRNRAAMEDGATATRFEVAIIHGYGRQFGLCFVEWESMRPSGNIPP